MRLLAFALNLNPGMFGSNLGELDAFVQPARDRDNLAASAAGAGRGPVWMQNQYRAALELARSEHELVFVDSTGYGCTNCHWMKANLFPQAEVASAMKDFVLLELYTDGSGEQSGRIRTWNFPDSIPSQFRSTRPWIPTRKSLRQFQG